MIAKGGSYLSTNEPIQLTIDARAPMETADVLESLGFRLAKSLKPGYDMLYSWLRGTYNRGPFAPDQDVALAGPVGAERYELGADGFPTAYHAVSLAPVNWLSNEKGAELSKLLVRSQQTPLLVGTIALTEKLANPTVPAGLYSVLFRDDGMPKELTEAIKLGFKDVQAELKAKGRQGAGEPAEVDEAKEKRKNEWRQVLTKYGLVPSDLEPKEAANGLDFVRIDGLDVSTKQACFLLFGNEGKVVAVIPTAKKPAVVGKPVPSTLEFEADANGKTQATFKFCVPVWSQDAKKAAEFTLGLTVDCAPPTAETPWRLPQGAGPAPAKAPAANNNRQAPSKDTGEAGVGGTNGGPNGGKSEPKGK